MLSMPSEFQHELPDRVAFLGIIFNNDSVMAVNEPFSFEVSWMDSTGARRHTVVKIDCLSTNTSAQHISLLTAAVPAEWAIQTVLPAVVNYNSAMALMRIPFSSRYGLPNFLLYNRTSIRTFWMFAPNWSTAFPDYTRKMTEVIQLRERARALEAKRQLLVDVITTLSSFSGTGQLPTLTATANLDKDEAVPLYGLGLGLQLGRLVADEDPAAKRTSVKERSALNRILKDAPSAE